MTRSYSFSDTLPKDSGGAKFAGLPDISTSQLDFALPIGLGASTIGGGSKVHAYLGIGTAISGSPLTNAPAGVLPLLGYTTNASSITVNGHTHQRGNQYGEAYFTSLSTVTCAVNSASRETITTTCGTLYKILCAGCGLVAGAQVAILNGTTSLAHFSFGSALETLPLLDLGSTGTCYGSLIIEKRGSVSDAFVTLNYRNGFSQ